MGSLGVNAADTLRRLLAYADRGGAEREWLADAADELVAHLLHLAELRRLVDPRRLHTANLVQRVAAADARLRRNGTTTHRVAILTQQFGLSRSRVYALLRLSCESQDTNMQK